MLYYLQLYQHAQGVVEESMVQGMVPGPPMDIEQHSGQLAVSTVFL